MTNTTVKYLHSAMPGAPILNGTPGSMIAVLDSCLVNGFGLKSVDSLVVLDGVATANISTGHSAEVGTVVAIAGATVMALNGQFKVIATTPISVKFAVPNVSNQEASGSITLKNAAAGWVKQFAGSNLAAYKSVDMTATGFLLRVDDANAKFSRVCGYEAMSDVNTGTGLFPTPTQRAGGSYWIKSNAADVTPRAWLFFGDGKTFYLCREYYPSQYPGAYDIGMFGDPKNFKAYDPYGCCLYGSSNDYSLQSPCLAGSLAYSDPVNSAELYFPRSFSNLGGSAIGRRSMPAPAATSLAWFSAAMAGIPYPNSSDGGIYLVPQYLLEHVNGTLRGTSPGLYCVPQNAIGAFAVRDSFVAEEVLPGRVLKAVTVACVSTVLPNLSFCLFDVTGPWV